MVGASAWAGNVRIAATDWAGDDIDPPVIDRALTPRPATSAEAFANARLIAAAPDLLALAQQYASECGECAGVGITPDDQDCSECKLIRDVIAKATQS